MSTPVLNVVVIGAGHAGLSLSYCLKSNNVDHLVIEQGSIGDTWRKQRWDSFKLNTPNKTILLPGQNMVFSDEEGFCSAGQFISSLESYANSFDLPVIDNSRVLSVDRTGKSEHYSIIVENTGSSKQYRCKNVVIASGVQNIKSTPLFSKNLSPRIYQIHSGDYKNASLLPDGAVLVIGGAQSGVQIAEDLINNGRQVFISSSQVPRVPRRYRGKDIVDWLILTGFYDLKVDEVADPKVFKIKQPQISNTGSRGHTLSLQGLAKRGAVILGKADSADSTTLFLQPNAAANVKFADGFSKKVKDMIDEYIKTNRIDAPLPENDPEDEPDVDAICATELNSLDLAENNITSVIWATGFTGDLNYLKVPVTSENGFNYPVNGANYTKGLYFLGFPWLRKRKSGIILGIREDAEFISGKILENS